MSSQFESKRSEIESIIKKKKIIGYASVVISILLILSISLYNYFIADISNNLDMVGIIYIILISSLMIGLDYLDNPVNPYDYAFFEIVEALRLIEKPGKSDLLNLKARRRVLKAYGKIARATRKKSTAPWYSTSNEIQKIFTKNLKTRIAPAFKNDTISSTYLLDIACALRGSHISLLENVNNQLSKNLDEIVEEKETITSRMTVVISNNTVLNYLHKSSLFKPIITIMAGFAGIIILCFFYSVIFPTNNFYNLVSDPQIFIIGGLAVSTLIMGFPILISKKNE